MIIYTINNLTFYETRSDKPNSDWTGKAEFIIDEQNSDNIELINKIKQYAPFVTLIVDDNNTIIDAIDNISAKNNWEQENKPSDKELLTKIRDTKIIEISKACNLAIINGIDIETNEGIEHFSLHETDQINLSAAFTAIQQGAIEYPYHADGKLCRMFTAEEITKIMTAATQHKIYHTTLCNHILSWIRRSNNEVELRCISYSAKTLPSDLAENMNNIFTTAASN